MAPPEKLTSEGLELQFKVGGGDGEGYGEGKEGLGQGMLLISGAPMMHWRA